MVAGEKEGSPGRYPARFWELSDPTASPIDVTGKVVCVRPDAGVLD